MTVFRTPRPALLAVGIALCLLRSVSAQEIQWRYDYNKARQEAAQQNRPLLIDFGREQCVWCVQLDVKTFTDPEVRTTVNDRFIPLKIDAGRYPDLVEKLNIRSFPTLVFANSEGRILYYQ